MTQRQGDVQGEIGNRPGPLWVCRAFAWNAQVEVQGSFHLGRSKRITNNWICIPPCPCTGPKAFQCNIFILRSEKSHRQNSKVSLSFTQLWKKNLDALTEIVRWRKHTGSCSLLAGWTATEGSSVGGCCLARRTSAPDSFGASWPNNRTMDKYLSPNHRLWFPDGLMLCSIGRLMMLSKAKWSWGPLFFCLWYILAAISVGFHSWYYQH